MRRTNIAEDVGGQELQSDPNAEREQEIDPEQEYQDSFTAAELQTLAEDDRLSLFQILGSNKTEFAEGVQRTTVKLFRGATPLTVIEEKLEGDADIMLKDAARREWLLYSLIRFQRTSGQRIFREGITRNEDITDSDLKEAWSHLGQSYLVGRSRKSERADLGFLGAGGRKAAADILKSGLGGSMEGYHRFFRSVWKRAAKLNKLRREGKLDAELERELARSVGFGEQAEYEASVETEAAALLREMEESEMVREPVGASTFEPTDDAPFSVIQAVREDVKKYLAVVGEDDLSSTQPNVSFPQKLEQLDLFFSSVRARESVIGPKGDSSERLAPLRINGESLAEVISEVPQVDFIGEEVTSTEELARKAQALRNPGFETFYIIAMGKGKRTPSDPGPSAGRAPRG